MPDWLHTAGLIALFAWVAWLYNRALDRIKKAHYWQRYEDRMAGTSLRDHVPSKRKRKS